MNSKLVAAAVIPLLGLALQAAPQDRPAMPMSMSMMMDCGKALKGAKVETENIADGISLTVTTETGDVAALRKQLEHMASMHSAASDRPMGAMNARMIPFTARYTEVTKGARLSLTPKDRARLEEFRTAVRAHAERMQKGECSMMEDMGQGMMRNTPKAEQGHESHQPAEPAK